MLQCVFDVKVDGFVVW